MPPPLSHPVHPLPRRLRPSLSRASWVITGPLVLCLEGNLPPCWGPGAAPLAIWLLWGQGERPGCRFGRSSRRGAGFQEHLANAGHSRLRSSCAGRCPWPRGRGRRLEVSRALGDGQRTRALSAFLTVEAQGVPVPVLLQSPPPPRGPGGREGHSSARVWGRGCGPDGLGPEQAVGRSPNGAFV